MNPKYSIVIPCRNNGGTIKDSIKTILINEYESYEIIVCDNNSKDNTEEIIRNFHNKKIKYFKSNKDLSMSENWERCLDYIKGEYLFYLGGDDGLIKDCFLQADYLFKKYNCDIISWDKQEFSWPSSKYKSNVIKIKKNNYLINMNPKRNLVKVLSGNLSYSYLPSVYNSFVKSSVIKELRLNNLIFFKGIHPDIYSSLIISSVQTKQLYCTSGLSICAASDRSNGLNNSQGDCLEESEEFFTKGKVSDKFPSIVALPTSYELDSFDIFIETNKKYSKYINRNKFILKIISEIKRVRPGYSRDFVSSQLINSYKLNKKEIKMIENLSFSNEFIGKKSSKSFILDNPEYFELNFNNIKSLNILDAQELINNYYKIHSKKFIFIKPFYWKLRRLLKRVCFAIYKNF